MMVYQSLRETDGKKKKDRDGLSINSLCIYDMHMVIYIYDIIYIYLNRQSIDMYIHKENWNLF